MRIIGVERGCNTDLQSLIGGIERRNCEVGFKLGSVSKRTFQGCVKFGLTLEASRHTGKISGQQDSKRDSRRPRDASA